MRYVGWMLWLLLMLTASLALADDATPVRVAVMGEPLMAGRLARIGYDVWEITSPEEITADRLRECRVLFLGTGTAPKVAEKAAVVADFVRRGGGLIVEQPNVNGPVAVLPPAAAVTIASLYYDGSVSHPDPIRNGCVTPEGQCHPLTAGLTEADFPGVCDKVCRADMAPAYTVLAVQVTNADLVQAAVAYYGDGRIVFETGNTLPNSITPGSDRFLQRAVDWAAFRL